MAPTVPPPDEAIERLHGSDGENLVVANPQNSRLFHDAFGHDSYSDLFTEVSDNPMIDDDVAKKAWALRVGAFKPDATASDMSLHDFQLARTVFAEPCKDSNDEYSCQLFAGFLDHFGIASERHLTHDGKFAPVLVVRDWRHVQWKPDFLDFNSDGSRKLDTDLNAIRRRILRQLLEMRNLSVQEGWGELARVPSGH